MEQQERQGPTYESFGDSLAPPPLQSTGDSVLGASSSFLSMVQSYWSSAPSTVGPSLQSPAKQSPRGRAREGSGQTLGQTRHPMYSLDTPSALQGAAPVPTLTANKGASIVGSGSIDADVQESSSRTIYDDPITSNDASSHLLKPMISKDFWMRDEYAKECYDCRALFTTFRRKHHCRICGQIFCFKCASSVIPGDRFGYQGDL